MLSQEELQECREAAEHTLESLFGFKGFELTGFFAVKWPLPTNPTALQLAEAMITLDGEFIAGLSQSFNEALVKWNDGVAHRLLLGYYHMVRGAFDTQFFSSELLPLQNLGLGKLIVIQEGVEFSPAKFYIWVGHGYVGGFFMD